MFFRALFLAVATLIAFPVSQASAQQTCNLPDVGIRYGYMACHICKAIPGNETWYRLSYCDRRGRTFPMSNCDRFGPIGQAQCLVDTRPVCRVWRTEIVEVGGSACVEAGSYPSGKKIYEVVRCEGPGVLYGTGTMVDEGQTQACPQVINLNSAARRDVKKRLVRRAK